MTEVLIDRQTELVADTGSVELLVDTVEALELLEVGAQGPAGPPGDSTVTYLAGTTMSGHRVVWLDAGVLQYVDPAATNIAALGVSRNAAAAGDPVTVQIVGVMSEPSWNWVPGLPIFCGPDGALTQTPPSAGGLLTVGSALTATQFYIRIESPIIL